MTIQLYTYWYLHMILVFTNDAGIYAPYWYLCAILVFTCNTDIHLPYWYLRAILVFTHSTGIYAQYWYLHVHSMLVLISIDYSSYPWLISCDQISIKFISQNKQKIISNLQLLKSNHEVVESKNQLHKYTWYSQLLSTRQFQQKVSVLLLL